MAYIDWRMEGLEITNCNCDWGCPCQFNRPPTHGHCRAFGFVQIERGYFADVRLDGLRWGFRAAWPGPIHLGNGTLQLMVDPAADDRQRAAIEAVAQGRESEPGTLIFQVFAATFKETLPTIVAPIELAADLDTRQASVLVDNLVEGRIGPIRNPVTGAPHRVRVTLPEGFEYTDAEFASGTATVRGSLPMEFKDTHAHLARIHWGPRGVIRH